MSTFIYDPETGNYYDPIAGLYYDPKTQVSMRDDGGNLHLPGSRAGLVNMPPPPEIFFSHLGVIIIQCEEELGNDTYF